MIKYILGKSGTGKTTYINNIIAELVNQGESNIVMLVPDQSSFDYEKTLLNLLSAKKAKNVKVFGFSKLCRYVFEKTNNIPENVIDDGTRAVIMNLALEQLTEKLTLFSSKNSRSVSDVMLKTLTECKKNAVSTDMLRTSALKVEDKTLKSKLNETALILDTFDALLSQSYIDPLDDLTRLYEILLDSNIFSGYTLFIDSFSGFTAQQMLVLRQLFNQCKATYLALSLDPLSKGNDEVFDTSYKTLRAITELANRDFIDIKKPVELFECKRFKNSELEQLESGIFRNDYEAYSINPENINLYSASDIYNECEYVAKKIKKLVIEEGYLYSEISVITEDIQPYNGILNVVFDKYEIPYFMDTRKDIEVKPVIRFVTALFKIVLNNFEREDVISVLKTGLTSIPTEDISVFENYAYIWNINGPGFKKEFKLNPRGFANEFSEDDDELLATIENVRKSIIEPVLKFKSDCKDKNGREITELLYKFIQQMGVQTALDEMYDTLENHEKGTGAEQIKIYNMLIEILDKMVAVVGNKQLTLKRYFELLTIQISSMQISEIPQTIDSVSVTTSQRLRNSNHKASFLIGCVDGQFPAVPNTTGVFSSFELKILSLNDVSINEDFSGLTNLETFMAYCCMTSASKKLFFSYPLSDSQGTKLIPSKIIDEVRKVFPKIVYEDENIVNSAENSMWAIQPAFEEYAKAVGSGSEKLSSLKKVFENNEYYYSKSIALERAIDSLPFKIENVDNTHKLFGDNLRVSASQIEKFNLCRFSYFCNYGLRVKERRKAEINPLEYGTLVHFILEKFFDKYTKSEYSTMNEDDIKEFVAKTLNDYAANYFGGSETKSNSFIYKLITLKENVCLLLNHIIAELSQSDFNVTDCELRIGSDIPAYTIKLPSGENIAVQGSVDRVDIMNKNGVKYLRVVDYKTGTKQFKLSDILYGLNLQMLLYLYSVMKNGTKKYGKTTPAGILYMPATVPIVTVDNRNEPDTITQEVEKALKMNGLVLNEVEVIRGMDKSETAKYIPVKIKLDTPVSDRSMATLEEFGKIFNKLDMTVAEMGRELYKGNIQASPVKGTYDACEYCPYDSVCSYHMCEHKNTNNLKNNEVYDLIEKQIN